MTILKVAVLLAVSCIAVSSDCGNFIVEDNEECDAGAGNGLDGVGCLADCTLPVCGDGHRAPGEYCDDGNLIPGDGCDENCMTEHIFPSVSESDGTTYEVAAPDATTVFGDSLLTLKDSEHFVIRASFDDKDLLDEELKNGTLRNKKQKQNLKKLEKIWKVYIDNFGFAPPYFERKDKYKVNVFVTDYGYLSGGAFKESDPWPPGQHPHIQMRYTAFESYGGMLHEFSHSIQNMIIKNNWFDYGGWFSESHAEFMRFRAEPTGVGCSEKLVNAPHLYYGTTRNRYCNWQFWDYITEVFGIQVVNGLWSGNLGGPTDTLFPNYIDVPCSNLDGPFAVLLRSLDWSIEQLNDLFGRWAMANAAWDYAQKGDLYQNAYGSYSEEETRTGTRGRLTRLESAGDNSNNNLYYFPPEELAPQRWGYNLVRLIPDNGVDSIIVTFRGVVQKIPARTEEFGAYNKEPSEIQQPDSGWRWGLVAVDSSGSPRYSSLQAGARASLRFKIDPDDQELYLVVLGAPMSLHQILWDQMYYSIYRYPWRIKLENALPQGFEPTVSPPGLDGGPHSNGGGFVQSTAQVDDEAYIGPKAKVLDSAQIGKGARVEDHAIVRGDAKVMGKATVKGHALLEGNAVVTDNAVVHGSAQMNGGEVYENAEVGGLTWICCNTKIYGSARVISTSVERPLKPDARIFGDVQLLGDIEYSVDEISSGVWYGFVHPEFMGDPEWGSNRAEPETEVTISTKGMDWDTDDSDCRYTHISCAKNEACILVGNTYECVTGANAPQSYERSHKEMVIKCVIGDCVDNKDFKYKGKKKKDCKWVAKEEDQRKQLCKENGEVQQSCPVSCGFCCADNNSFKFKGKKTCKWLAKKESRIEEYCTKGSVKSNCSKTCDYCFNENQRKKIKKIKIGRLNHLK